MEERTERKDKNRIMAMIHKSLANGIRSSKANVPRKWLESKKLSIEATGVCFNSGQIHHRRPKTFIEQLLSVGFLKESDMPTNTGEKGYTVFGTYAIHFPLRNEKNEVVNLYAISIRNGKTAFLNEEGIYPAYPSEHITKLYIVDSIIDAATLLESNVLDNRETVMAVFDGEWKPQHYEAVRNLKELKEIIYISSKERKKK